ncbi:MAG: hypothetical protein JXR39_11555 [Marinilabiliaceae bacterium]|nr:hypothetical protein [Marinilabiliaceae bacterium]
MSSKWKTTIKVFGIPVYSHETANTVDNNEIKRIVKEMLHEGVDTNVKFNGRVEALGNMYVHGDVRAAGDVLANENSKIFSACI